jgi:hypothetical protein
MARGAAPFEASGSVPRSRRRGAFGLAESSPGWWRRGASPASAGACGAMVHATAQAGPSCMMIRSDARHTPLPRERRRIAAL